MPADRALELAGWAMSACVHFEEQGMPKNAAAMEAIAALLRSQAAPMRSVYPDEVARLRRKVAHYVGEARVWRESARAWTRAFQGRKADADALAEALRATLHDLEATGAVCTTARAALARHDGGARP